MTDNICRSESPAPLIADAILPQVRLLTWGNFCQWGHRGAAPESGELESRLQRSQCLLSPKWCHAKSDYGFKRAAEKYFSQFETVDFFVVWR